MTGTFRI